MLGLPVRPRDHDRPGCGGRGFAGFSGSRRGHGRPSRKGDGRGYQGPGCGRGGGTERSRRGGNSGDRGGAQSQRLWDGRDDQSRKIGRSRRLPSSGGNRSREMGRSPRLLCRRSRWLCREPGEKGGVDALSLREGCGRGVFLNFNRSNACLILPVSPCRFFEGRGGFFEPMAGGGRVAVQGGELRTERSCHTFVSWRDTRFMAASCARVRLSQMDAKCSRWGGGPSLKVGKVRGSGAAGRNPGVRPVPEPVLAQISVGAIGERSKSGPGAEGGGEAVLVVLVVGLGNWVAEVLEEDMLREARNGARGEKLRGGRTQSVKGGWLATSVVTRGAVAEIR